MSAEAGQGGGPIRVSESVLDLIKLYEDYTLGYYNGAVPPGRARSSLDLAVPPASRPLPARASSAR